MAKTKIDHVGSVDIFKETKIFDWDALWGWIFVIGVALFLLSTCSG